MTRTRLVIWLGLGVLAAAAIAPTFRNGEFAIGADDMVTEPLAPLAVTGFVYEELGEPPAYSLRIRRITRQKLRLGPLAVNPFREVVMDDVRITLRPGEGETGQASEPADVTGFAKELLGIAEVGSSGSVRRVIANRLTVRGEAAGDLLFVLEAGRAEISGKLERWELDGGVAVTSRNGRRLDARRAVWLDGGQRLEVRDGFEFADRGDSTVGSGAVFTLDMANGDLGLASNDSDGSGDAAGSAP